MHLSRGFNLALKYYPLVLLVAIADLLNLGEISRRFQFDFHIKFTIPSALPSLTQVLPDPPAIDGSFVNINLPFAYLGGAALLLFIVFFFITAYLKGGFLGCVLEALTGGPVDREVFFSSARKFWGRFLIQAVIMFAAIIFLGLLFVGIGPLAFVFIFVLVAAFFLLTFWDYSLVREDLGVVDAAERSWRLVVANMGSVILFLIPIFLITGVFSVVANALVPTPLVLVALVAYAYLGTSVVFAVMSFYIELTGEEAGPEEEL